MSFIARRHDSWLETIASYRRCSASLLSCATFHGAIGPYTEGLAAAVGVSRVARRVSESGAAGRLQLKKLCERFSIDFKTAQNGFRNVIDHGVSRMPDELVELKGAVETIPVTSADAERGFSTMNVLLFFTTKPAGRAARGKPSLHKPRIVVGPSLEDFSALPRCPDGSRQVTEERSKLSPAKCRPPHESRYSHMCKIFA